MSTRLSSQPETGTTLPCYHCGETVPKGVDYQTEIQGQFQPMCCVGCRAVALLIAANGLETFYQQRTAFNVRPDLSELDSGQHYALYNDPAVNRAFTDQGEDGLSTARLLIGGITCAACTWLIEQTLSQREGINTAVVNLGQSRLDVSYDPTLISPGDIFRHVDELGYKSRPFQTSTQRTQLAAEYKDALRQLAVAGLGMMQVGMFAIALHAGDIQGIESEYRSLLRWASLLVASFVVGYSARTFFSSAWRHLKMRTLVMDLPVSLAIGLAWLASLWATVIGQGQVYFDSIVMFTFFLLLGRFLERRARQRDQLAWCDAESTLPLAVKVRREEQWQEVVRARIKPGEHIMITAGETIPVDARVERGRGSVNESAFNGEQLPRTVTPGDSIYAGTLNIDSVLEARVIGSYADTRLAALQRSLATANTEKPAKARLADQIASRFVAMVLLVTAVTAATWFVIDPTRTLWISLSVLVVSCPCALALATPAALTAASSGLRRSGVIVRGENAVDALARCSHLIFDKTGTLTEGKLELSETQLLSGLSQNEALNLAASLQLHSSHPLATAFSGLQADLPFEQVQYRVGSGLEGQLGGHSYRIGSRDFCKELTPDLPPSPDADHYWIALCRENTALAWFGLTDKLREEAAAVVRAAGDSGLQVELLTGDSSPRSRIIATGLGISTVHSGVTPEQKMAYVQELQRGGAVVAMVGDGLNDAPVLGVADSSFAVAGATGLAKTQADFILLDSNLMAVMDSWKRAKRCAQIIRQNLSWALCYNLCGIPLAAFGFIPPWMAAIGMSASSLLVVLNSLRLNTVQPS